MFASQRISRSSQYRCFLSRLGVVLCLILSTVLQSEASNVLRYMPEDALGFVLVRNLEKVDTKVGRFTDLFGLNFPAPLAFAKFATGLGEGLQRQGDLLVALLPGSTEAPEPQPMVLLPVNDYVKFAASIHGDASGEICRVAIAGESVLVAKFGEYALLMDVEHRETLELMLGLQQAPVDSLKPLDFWIDENDVVVAIMPKGLETFLSLGKKIHTRLQGQLEEKQDDSVFVTRLYRIKVSAETLQWVLESVKSEIKLVAVAVSLDEDTNLRVSKRVLLKEGGSLEKTLTNSRTDKPKLLAYGDQPFIWSGASPVSSQLVEAISHAFRILVENDPKSFGLEDLEKSDWDLVEESYALMGKGVRSLAITMLPGESGDPLASHVYGVLKVENTDAYFEACQKSFELWEKVAGKSTSEATLKTKFLQTGTEGEPTYEISIDIGSELRDPNVPLTNWLLEALLGKEDHLRFHLIPVDDETIVLAVAGKEEVQEFLEHVKKPAADRQIASSNRITSKLLSASASRRLLVSPQGCVKWGKRIVDEFLTHLLGKTPKIPAFDSCPPVGFSLNLVDSRIEADLVCPVETLKALAAYIKKCQEL